MACIRVAKKEFCCPHCSYVSSVKCNINKHIVKVHESCDLIPKKHNVFCNKCTFGCFDLKTFAMHYRTSHNFATKIEELIFPTVGEFEKWKNDRESATCYKFLHTKHSLDKEGTKLSRYRCSGSGNVKLGNLRGLQEIGCPAFIYVKHLSFGISVSCNTVHVHDEKDRSFSKGDKVKVEFPDQPSNDATFISQSGSTISPTHGTHGLGESAGSDVSCNAICLFVEPKYEHETNQQYSMADDEDEDSAEFLMKKRLKLESQPKKVTSSSGVILTQQPITSSFGAAIHHEDSSNEYLENFGKVVVGQMKKLHPDLHSETMFQIQKILMEQEKKSRSLSHY